MQRWPGHCRPSSATSGRACTAGNRFLVRESVADQFTERITAAVKDMVVGDGRRDEVTIGPLIDRQALNAVSNLVDDAVSRGARLQIGGRPVDGAGSFYEPTVLSDVPVGSRLLREEIFGPVVAIVPFAEEH
jgi:succinate-semialdehyde dehydrogenase / glutarate-semialdehyde dehydrogenase